MPTRDSRLSYYSDITRKIASATLNLAVRDHIQYDVVRLFAKSVKLNVSLLICAHSSGVRARVGKKTSWSGVGSLHTNDAGADLSFGLFTIRSKSSKS